MNKTLKKQIQDDYREILRSDAGKRVLGGIFFAGRINGCECMSDFHQGRRSLAVLTANTVAEIDPYGIAECMKAYSDLMKRCEDNGRNNDNSGE
ncbi:MAG: hypothetical protein IJ587_10695 [Synergistaceae bacterium]|nr:hypothetical protein [Synergistaceae bacterium]